MAMATNVVDNLHAGGIAAAMDLASGQLSAGLRPRRASEASGWLSTIRRPAHKSKAGPAEWPEVADAGQGAHTAFSERVMPAWDIALLDDGPILVEGNARPDLDIIQRPLAAASGRPRSGAAGASCAPRLGDI